jgi:WD40 repeat protein
VQSLEHPFPLYSVAFSPDGTLLATGDHAGTVRLWEVATWKPRKVLTRHEGPVRVAFSPTGQTLATGGHDRTVVLWDMPGGQPQVILSCREPVACVAFSGNGAYLATAGGDGKVKNRPGEVKVWDVAQGQEMFQMLGHSDVVLSVAFAPGGGRVATASRDHTVRLWELPVPR